MADGRALLVVAALGCTGCTETFARLLDFVCRESVPNAGVNPNQVGSGAAGPSQFGENCELENDAVATTGLTSDSLAFHFGPDGGSLAILMAAVPAALEAKFSLEVLVASSSADGSVLTRELTWGSCGASCPVDPPRADADVSDAFVWVTLIGETTGTQGEPIPSDAILTLSGRELDIVDLRTPGAEGIETPQFGIE
jgi:hypothetical protein